jgi:hypothetical protein
MQMSEQSETPPSETPPIETPSETPPAAEPSLINTPPAEPAPEFVPLAADALQVPEGFEVDDGLRDEFLGLVNNRELSEADRANGLLGLWQKGLQTAETRGIEAFNSQVEVAQNEVKADPELGGAKLPATLQSIGKLMEEFGTPELRSLLDTTGAGNSIHVVRFLHSLAGKLTEGSIQPPGTPPTSSEDSRAARLFPSMKG